MICKLWWLKCVNTKYCSMTKTGITILFLGGLTSEAYAIVWIRDHKHALFAQKTRVFLQHGGANDFHVKTRMCIYMSMVWLCLGMETEAARPTDTWLTCPVCRLITNENTPELHQFISEQSKKYPLAVIVDESIKFVSLLLQKSKNVSEKNADCSQSDMLRHIRFCVGCHDHSVRMLLCNYSIMESLTQSTNTQERNAAINMLLKTKNPAL